MNNNLEDVWHLKIKKLRSKLINEEHRLVLMKKIRQSQTRPINQQQQQQQQQQQSQQHGSTQSGIASLASNCGIAGSSGLGISSSQSANPAKKLRPTLPTSVNNSSINNNINNNNNNNINSNQLNAQLLASQKNFQSSSPSIPSPAHAHQRTKNNTLWNPPPQQVRQPTPAGLAPPHVGNLSRQPITTPPNVVQAMMGSLNASQQSLLMNQINALTGAATTPNINRRPHSGSTQRQQPITAPPNIIQGVTSGHMSGQQPPMSSRRAHSGNLSRQQPISTPPNVVQDIRASLAGQQSLLMNANNLSTPPTGRGRPQQQSSLNSTPQQQQPSPFNTKSQAAQILLQKRQAAKTAIQKQLEQTLMQLPQKHIQLGIDFIPNANNIEFVYYVGLEACVDYLTNTKSALDVEPLEKPFECSTCGTDFTASWSWKRSNAVCENCVGNHVKRSLKNSQANRIKSVLAKAAKQDAEMEQRMMAEAASVVSAPSTPTTSSNNQRHSLLQPVSQPQSQRSTPQQTPTWPRVNASPIAAVNRSSGSITNTTTSSPATANVQSALNINNPLAALNPAALASLLQMNPQFSSLASLMTPNAVPPTITTPQTNNNTNQIAQVAALLMNQLTMNLWNKR